MKRRILRNMAQCMVCKQVIESKHVHDFVTCKCGCLSVDGGKDYAKRVGNGFIELTEYQ